MSDNIRRPTKGITADMWAYFDKHPKGTAEQRTAHATKIGWNPSTLYIQYKAWYTFVHGEPPPTTGKARPRKTEAEKTAEREAKRAAREARKAGARKPDTAEKPVAEGEGTSSPDPTPSRPVFKVRKYPRPCSCGGFEFLPSRRCYYCDGIGTLQDGARAKDRPDVEYIAVPVDGPDPFAIGPTVDTAVMLFALRIQERNRTVPDTSSRRWNSVRPFVVYEHRRGDVVDKFGKHSSEKKPVHKGEL